MKWKYNGIMKLSMLKKIKITGLYGKKKPQKILKIKYQYLTMEYLMEK